jgi:hypothetical protein
MQLDDPVPQKSRLAYLINELRPLYVAPARSPARWTELLALARPRESRCLSYANTCLIPDR